jgi:hypothetical protein
MRLLEICSSTGSVGKPWRTAGHEVISLDMIPKVAQIAYATGLLGIAYNPFCHHGVNIELAGLHVAPIVLGIIFLD